jgi:hypothetical protein
MPSTLGICLAPKVRDGTMTVESIRSRGIALRVHDRAQPQHHCPRATAEDRPTYRGAVKEPAPGVALRRDGRRSK